jgi:hypothetical protein
MTSRRQFLQIGLAAGALPLASRAAAAAPRDVGRSSALSAAAHRDVGGPVALYKVVYDSRFAAGREFARRAAALGLQTAEIEGDITAFWYHELDQRWRGGERHGSPVAVAGLTAHGPLFCLERLAWDQRMRCVFRGEHASAPNGSFEHRLSGPLAMLQSSRAELAGEQWAGKLADIVTSCPSGRMEISSECVAAPVVSPPTDAETLYSWVIAPAVRA